MTTESVLPQEFRAPQPPAPTQATSTVTPAPATTTKVQSELSTIETPNFTPAAPASETHDAFDAKSLDDFDFSIDEDEDSLEASFKSASGQYGEISVAKIDDEAMGYGSLTRSSSTPAVHDPLAATTKPFYTKILASARAAIGSNQGMFILIAPCLGFLAIASTIFVVSSYAPKAVASVASIFGSDRTIIAPKDVYLTNTKVKRIALDSGAMVSQITGTIVNQSTTTFKDIEVQGLVFDRSNNVIGKQTAKASSNIGKSRLQSLTADMITDLQETSSAKNYSLKAGSESPFTAVVLENPSVGATAPKTFVARVYSGRVR